MRVVDANVAANIAALAVFAGSSHALLVASGSPCAVQCGNVLDNTTAADIACSAPQYSGSPQGTVFQNCVGCELKSPYLNQKENDLQWMLCEY